jgi:hypothetical protein
MNRRLAGNEEGLVGYWPLTEGYGTTAYDYSTHGLTAHLGTDSAGLTIPLWVSNTASNPTLQTTADAVRAFQQTGITATSAAIPGTYLLPGYTYNARVKAETPQSRSQWSTMVPIDIPLQPGWYRADSNVPWATMNFPTACLNYHDKMWVITSWQDKSFVYTSTDGITWDGRDTGQKAEWDFLYAPINASGVVFQDRIWILGGLTSGKAVNDIRSFDEKSSARTVPSSWSPRYDMCCVVFKNSIWVFAGRDEKNNFYNDIWSSTDGTKWQQLKPTGSMWSPRSGAAAVAYNNRLWLLGGTDAHGNLLQEIWSTADGVSWTQSPQPSWQARTISQAIGDERNTKIWLLGGSGVGSLTLADMWHSSDGTNWSWDTLQLPWNPRPGSCAVVFKNRIYILGGSIIFGNPQRTSQEVWFYQLPS